jgi:hypothetical protein
MDFISLSRFFLLFRVLNFFSKIFFCSGSNFYYCLRFEREGFVLLLFMAGNKESGGESWDGKQEFWDIVMRILRL